MKMKIVRALFTPLAVVVIALWGALEGVLALRDALVRTKHNHKS